MSDLIDLLERKQLIWHGRDYRPPQDVVPSGHAVFDEKLAGGFPKNGVVSIESQVGVGELRFLMNTLATKERLLVFINPPGILCAEFFYHQGLDLNNILVIYPRQKNEALWASEQCLKSGACSAVMLWHNMFEIHHVKRLQVASDEGNCLQFLMRSNHIKSASLPVSMNMQFAPHVQGLDITINKRKGGWELPRFTLDMSADWPSLSLGDETGRGAANNVIPFPASNQNRGA